MSSRGTILILTSGSPSRNPRPAKEAATLARAGFAVTLLHPSEGAALDRRDDALATAGAYADVRLQLDPAAFLPRLSRWLAVRALALGHEDVAALGPARALWREARRRPADLTIVHNEIALWVGARLRAEGRRVAADIEDWYSEDLPAGERRHRPLRLLRQLEGGLLRNAAYVSTTSAALSAALHDRFGGRPALVIANTFPLAPEFRAPVPAEGPAGFLWFSQTVGPGRGLERFLQSWQRLRRPGRVVLLGEPMPGYPDALRAVVPAERRHLLEFRPPVPPEDLPAEIARHDIGLALEEPAIPSRDLTITNKILQYLVGGLAVVATPTAGQREVLRQAPGAGILLAPDSGDAAAAELERLAGGGAFLADCQRAARAAAERQFCWEKTAPLLVAAVEAALTTS